MNWSCNSTVPLVVGEAVHSSGLLFASAVRSMIAAHCALTTPEQWPRDRTDEILADPNFDYIIVGAGSAGSVLAHRLSEDPALKVLLVEAGDDPTLDTELVGGLLSVDSENDWQYRTEPQTKACLSSKNRQCYFPRAKTLGGCSSTNGMYYIRGHRDDYDNWRDLGNEGWSYDDVLPYFKKSEGLDDDQLPKEEREKYHNENGLLKVGRHIGKNALSDVLLNGYEELGIPVVLDVSGSQTVGTMKTLATVRNGRRQSTARAFLTPARYRDNLFVMKNTLATRVLLDDNSAIGIEVQKSNKIYEIYARKEVILSAGIVNTPQILMLSGIGPKDHLEELGIDVVKDLPVGQHLQDHAIVFNFIKLKINMPVFDTAFLTNSITEYLLSQTGPFSNIGPSEVVAILNIHNLTNTVQNIHFHHFLSAQYKHINMYKLFNFNDEVTDILIKNNAKYPLLGILSTLLQPKSSGVVKLRSIDPNDKPVIDTNLLDHPDDLNTLVKSMEFIDKLLNTEALQGLNASRVEMPLDACKDCQDEELYVCLARHLTSTLCHPVGTARMGREDDSTAVVSPELRVHGILNLRVVDCSVMPQIVRGNTNAPVIMIAEKAADMIKQSSDDYDSCYTEF